MRKAQTISQPFIYMAAIIIAGFILILGARVIMDLREMDPQITQAVFVSKITEDFKSVNYREIRTLNYNIGDYTCACFVGTGITGIISNTYIQTSYLETPAKNLFLGNKYKPESFVPMAELGEIKAENDEFICYAIRNGILEFTVEGLGGSGKVKVLKPTDSESEKCKETSP